MLLLQQMKDPDFEMVFLLLVASVALTDLFLYCYFAKLAAESYEKMSDCLYYCNWPDLPNQMRKYFIIMIGNSQRPQCYAGSKLVVLNLDTFCSASIRSSYLHSNRDGILFMEIIKILPPVWSCSIQFFPLFLIIFSIFQTFSDAPINIHILHDV